MKREHEIKSAEDRGKNIVLPEKGRHTNAEIA